jgi:hypothetical protein
MIAVIVAAAITVGCGGKTSANIGQAPDKPAAVFWSGETDISWYSYEKDEFVINTAEELAGLAALVNKGCLTFQDKTITLGRDIIINDTANWLDWANNPPAHQWIAIGTDDDRFHGIFNGNGHTVSGVYIKNPEDDQGLFGVIGFHGRVSRLNVTASYIEGGDYVGILAGGSAGVIAGCSTSGIVAGDSIVGGFTGVNDGAINSSYAAGSVKGRIHVGRFMGANRRGIALGNHSSVVVSGGHIAGEFAGVNWGGITSGKIADTAGGIDRFFASGEGTGKDPYIISTKEQLENFSMLVNMGLRFSGGYIKLGQSIALNDTANWRQWAAEPPDYVWVPAGVPIHPFDGTFDGGGHTVRGVYANDPQRNFIGLFGVISGNATIKNIGVIASYVRGSGAVGGLVGSNGNIWYNGGRIIDSYSTAIVEGSGFNVGGLTGGNIGGWIISCYATGRVSGNELVGGLVGVNVKGGVITNSYAAGAVSGVNIVGGLIGSNTTEEEGGIVIGSYATGAVSGSEYIGGLAGSNVGFSMISNSYATGAVSGVRYVGGLVGGSTYNTVNYSYSIGAVKGERYAGGLMGWNQRSHRDTTGANNCYFDIQTSGQEGSSGGTGRTTEEMKQKDTFIEWDFREIWGMDSAINNGYPHLLRMPNNPAIRELEAILEDVETETDDTGD